MSGKEKEQVPFARVFLETRRALAGYVRRIVGSPETADDIVQETYVRAVQQGGELREPKAFLYVTARNLARNHNRNDRIAATDTVPDIDSIGATSPDGQSPEDLLIADEEARLLRGAIERLPPQCRTAFTLKIFHGCSYREIGSRMGISVKTVEKHVSRGLRDTQAHMRRRYRIGDGGQEGPHG